jgi:hypothetical protein
LGDQTAGPGHVLDDQARIARQVASHVARERLRVEARAAAWREPHDDGDLLALVEIRHVLGGARRRRQSKRGGDEEHELQLH